MVGDYSLLTKWDDPPSTDPFQKVPDRPDRDTRIAAARLRPGSRAAGSSTCATRCWPSPQDAVELWMGEILLWKVVKLGFNIQIQVVKHGETW